MATWPAQGLPANARRVWTAQAGTTRCKEGMVQNLVFGPAKSFASYNMMLLQAITTVVITSMPGCSKALPIIQQMRTVADSFGAVVSGRAGSLPGRTTRVYLEVKVGMALIFRPL